MNFADPNASPTLDAPSADYGTGGVADPNINSMSLAPEEMPSLADFGREPSTGAWPDGWYSATITEGYATNSGHQWITGDTASKAGDSRNMRVCFAVVNKAKESRNYWASFNYRLGDFTPARIQAVVSARQHAKEQQWKGKWPGEMADLQRTSLAIGQLGQFERALGFRLQKTEAGFLDVGPFVGKQIDLRLKLNDETGFSEPVEFAKLAERAKLYK
jgi:hypothetical protein